MRVYNMSFFRKIITRHDTGLGEAYMDEDYEVTQAVLWVLAMCSHCQSQFLYKASALKECSALSAHLRRLREVRMMQVDDLGALIAVVTANACNIEGKRGALGLLNRLGDWLLTLAHRARANTVSTKFSLVVNVTVNTGKYVSEENLAPCQM